MFMSGWSGLAEEVQAVVAGRGAGQGLMRGPTAQPCLGVWVIYLGLCSLSFQLGFLFRGGTNCQHSSSSVDAIGQRTRSGLRARVSRRAGRRPAVEANHTQKKLNLPNLKKVSVQRYSGPGRCIDVAIISRFIFKGRAQS